MENYRVTKELGSGPLGTVYLAESQRDKRRYAVKMVECSDESAANKAFRESLRLHDVRHPFAAPYREIFVDWNAEHSSVYVCFVVDFFANGSLDSIVRRKLEDQRPLEEEIVRRWFGQTLEFLAFLHGRGLWHGDLRTSNVFLRDDLGVAIGDFCVATVMADHQTNTRVDKNCMRLVAPEVQAGRPDTHSFASDVWSLGACLLTLILCSRESQDSIAGLVNQAKSDHDAVHQALQAMADVYSVELLDACRQLLSASPEERPSVPSLTESGFGRECLNLAGSAMADRRRKREVTTQDRPLPTEGGAEATLRYLEREINNEHCFREGLERLCEELKSQGDVTSEQLRCLQMGLRSHAASAEVCAAFCCLLGNLAIRATPGSPLHSADSVQCVLLCMRSHGYDAALQRAACAVLMAFAADRRCSQLVGELGGVAAALDAVKCSPEDADLFTLAANALWTLCAHAANVRLCVERDGLLLVTDGMRRFADSPEAQEQAAALLLAFSMSQAAVQRASEFRVVPLLLLALRRHARFTKMARNCALAIASFVEADEECGLLALDCEEEDGGASLQGLSVYSEIFNIHRDNVEVAEALACLLFELAKYGELVKSVVDLSTFGDVVNQIRKRFLKTPSVAQPLNAALRNLESMRFGD